MLTLPDPHLGTANVSSPGRFLLWLAARQRATLAAAITFGVVWMLSQALVPWAVGNTIDAGVATGDGQALARWCAVLLGLGVVQVLAGVLRHRMSVFNWLQAALRSQQLVGGHLSEHGTAVSSRTTTGEVVSTVANDAPRVGEIFDVTARLSGALVAYAVVAVLLLRVDTGLGLLVLLGVPVLTSSLAAVVRPLQARQAAHRDAEGKLTALGADTVAGLRVLRGIGGEDQFVAGYRGRSQDVRRAGVRVSGYQATLDSAQVLLPGAFVVVLTWLGAHAALSGRITAGQLVTLYGYAAFLVLPLGTATEALSKYVRGHVAAKRILAVLRVRAAHAGQDGTGDAGDQEAGGALPPGGGHGSAAVLFDPASGLHVPAGRLTVLVAPVPDEAAELAYRLARLDADQPAEPAAGPLAVPAPRLGGVPVDRMPVDRLRSRVLVSEAEPRLFTGTLRDEVDPSGGHDEAAVLAALHVADAHDVLDALPDGLATEVEERGRSFSGGQRQRLALARALLADPEILVLIEPTSAVDAHTEARIAVRLRQARAGRTTLVASASPLLLDQADHVALLVDGRVVAEGTHRHLLATVPVYRHAVVRGEDS